MAGDPPGVILSDMAVLSLPSFLHRVAPCTLTWNKQQVLAPKADSCSTACFVYAFAAAPIAGIPIRRSTPRTHTIHLILEHTRSYQASHEDSCHTGSGRAPDRRPWLWASFLLLGWGPFQKDVKLVGSGWAIKNPYPVDPIFWFCRQPRELPFKDQEGR